jgi:hypothetical protein
MNAAHRLLATAIHPEVQHMVDTTLKMLKRKFPKVPKKLKVVFERRVGATFDPWDWELKMSDYGLDQPLHVVDKEEDQAQGPGTLQYGLEGTLIHEFGHAVNATIIKLHRQDDDALGAWQQTKHELEQKLGHPSAYAKKNNSEWFAEQFLYEMKGHGHALLDAIQEWSK